MSAKGDPCSGPLPRHRNPDKFGFHNGEGQWVSYEVTEGRLLFSCGHTARVAVGSAPGLPEDEVQAFVEQATQGVCASCASQAGRLVYHRQKGKGEVSGRETD